MTIENPTTDVDQQPASLPDAAVNEAAQLRDQTQALFTLEGTATENRGKLHFDIFHYVERYGRKGVEKLARDNDYSTTSKVLDCHLVAQFLTGINVNDKSISSDERARRQTRVRPFAQVLEALLRRRDEHANLAFDEWLTWYLEQQQQQGLIKSLGGNGSASKESDTYEHAPDSVVEDAFDSPAAVTLPAELNLPALIPGRPMLVMVRQEQSGVRLVPLPNASNSALASVAGYRASGLENASPEMRYWHQLMSVGTRIIPDTVSKEPVSDLQPDDEPNAATPMLPAYATYLWDDGKFSVAGARSHDTRIVEVIPRDVVDLDVGSKAIRFVDKRTRNTMAERLLQPSVCAGYLGEKGFELSTSGSRVRVKFAHTDKKLNGHLSLVPLTEFRTNWTSRVSPDFKPVADALMDGSAVSDFRSKFLRLLVSKSKSEAEVAVTISDGKITFKRDKAQSVSFAVVSDGSTGVRVMQSDLLAVIPSLLTLAPDGRLLWELDPEGLLMVETSTGEAVVRAYIQTLEKGRDTRSRQLLERVRAPKQLAPTASDTPATAA
ncbi:MAG: hypothetical protein HKO13_00310 [Sphingomonas sp.]|nr:hypothetical protein [Sphingomonas sp.]